MDTSRIGGTVLTTVDKDIAAEPGTLGREAGHPGGMCSRKRDCLRGLAAIFHVK
jgi:hypothetical protein